MAQKFWCRAFGTSSLQMGRLKQSVRVRPPIPPTAKEIKVPEDHPLWQFFKDKKLVRSEDELASDSWRPWTIPELRRKSFEDLHSLWYNCLKERNIVAREHLYYKQQSTTRKVELNEDMSQDKQEEVSEKIRTTMWRIRHVLSERQHAFENASQVFPHYKQQFLDNFEKQYLVKNLSEAEQQSLDDQLIRLNWAIFGVNISSWEQASKVDTHLVECVEYNAKLKLAKLEKQDTVELKNVYDCFPVFLASTEGVEDAIEKVKSRQQTEDYGEILRKVPVKQLEQAILEEADE